MVANSSRTSFSVALLCLCGGMSSCGPASTPASSTSNTADVPPASVPVSSPIVTDDPIIHRAIETDLPIAEVALDLSTSGPAWCWNNSKGTDMWTQRLHEAKYAVVLLERYFLSLINGEIGSTIEFPGIAEMRGSIAKGEKTFFIAQHIPDEYQRGHASVVKGIYPIIAEAFDRKNHTYYIEVENKGLVYGPDKTWAIRLNYENRLINGKDDTIYRFGKIYEFCVIPSKGKFTVLLPPARVPDRPPHPSDVPTRAK